MVKYSNLSSNKLRQRVYDRMADEWGLDYDLKLPVLLARLCGRDRRFLTGERMNASEIATCEALLGEHGYALYKMMVIRDGE